MTTKQTTKPTRNTHSTDLFRDLKRDWKTGKVDKAHVRTCLRGAFPKYASQILAHLDK